MSVFIIINEWTDGTAATSSQVVDAKYFESENDAWEALRIIAESYGTTVYADETTLQLSDHKAHIDYEEYYIQELTKKEID